MPSIEDVAVFELRATRGPRPAFTEISAAHALAARGGRPGFFFRPRASRAMLRGTPGPRTKSAPSSVPETALPARRDDFCGDSADGGRPEAKCWAVDRK
jgi:hypothetical protein